ncbi:unnamed protein product [Hymenolepis diminuta]|uniref:COesterase domain-containing protein n=1 Tax=Hymenolepis diminuta TaxID=6216 RepID=A0A158QEM1_HYMDI|nr:unnamed protein product [Hymenolepis diminuta]
MYQNTACRRVRVVEYHRLLEPDHFFRYKRPKIEPPGINIIFRLPLDRTLLFLILIFFIGVIVHFTSAYLRLPPFPPLPVNATSDCAFLQGSWNADQTVLRFYAVPYALPPLAKPDEATLDILQEYLHVIGGKPSLRWKMPQKVSGFEGCILAHYDRCSFKLGRWICDLSKPRPVSSCVQPKTDGRVDIMNPQYLFQNERCLQVDIATPTFEGTLKPVVIVIAGFQFLAEPMISPDSPRPAYWPEDETVRHSNAVWVYLHYRLGLAGFFYNLTHPRYKTKEKQQLSHENYALQDQLDGLRWIKTHIKQFGGDPQRMTVFGIASGATSVLALMKMKNKGENLFQQAWLSSGAVHWHSERDKTPHVNIVDKVFTDIAINHIGTHCKPSNPGTISKSCKLSEISQKLNDIPLQVINSLIGDNFKDENLIGEFMSSGNKSGNGMGWIYAETNSGNVLPPKYWTENEINHIFGRAKHSIRVVFSSMAQELEEWPGMGDTWLGEAIDIQIDKVAQMFDQYRHLTESRGVQGLKNLLAAAWKHDLTLQSMLSVPVRSQQDFHLEILSLIRFSCPQSWIISKFIKSKGVFYKLILDERSGRGIPFAPGPGFMKKNNVQIKREAFHSLDALILTGRLGNLREIGNQTATPHTARSFQSFSNKLRNMFKDFVHGKDLDSNCKADLKDPYGCRINGIRTEKFGDDKIMVELCAHIDWERWISNIIVHN